MDSLTKELRWGFKTYDNVFVRVKSFGGTAFNGPKRANIEWHARSFNLSAFYLYKRGIYGYKR